MTTDELGGILADLRAVIDRIARAHAGIDVDVNPRAVAGVVIVQHGLSLAADGLHCFARAMGCDAEQVKGIVQAHADTCRGKGIVGDMRVLHAAVGYIRMQAEKLGNVVYIGEEGETKQ